MCLLVSKLLERLLKVASFSALRVLLFPAVSVGRCVHTVVMTMLRKPSTRHVGRQKTPASAFSLIFSPRGKRRVVVVHRQSAVVGVVCQCREEEHTGRYEERAGGYVKIVGQRCVLCLYETNCDPASQERDAFSWPFALLRQTHMWK